MPIVKLPDGTLVNLPDENEPGILRKLGSAAKDLAVTGATGIAETVFGLPALTASVNNKLSGQTDAGTAKNFAGDLIEKVQDWEKRNSSVAGSPEANILKAGTGGLAGPGPKLANFLSGLAGGGASEIAAKFTDNPLLRGLAGLLGGGTAAFALGPKQTQVQKNLRRETENLSPQDWKQAENNLGAFQNAGARTPTLAEAFPGEGGVLALAHKAAGQRGGEGLRETLAGRKDDLSDLSLRFPRVIGPEVDTNAVAGQAAQAANRRFSQVKSAVQRPLNNIARDERSGRLPMIPERDVGNLEAGYKGFSEQPRIPAADAAARKDMLEVFQDPNADPRMVLDILKKADPNNITGGQVLNLTEAPGLQQSLASLLMNISQRTPAQAGAKAVASSTIPKASMNQARQAAFEGVSGLPAPWGDRAQAAGAEYLRRKNDWLGPRNQGPLRQLAGNTDPTKGPQIDSRLNAILDAPFPGKTTEILRELEKGGGNKRDIATALLQKELEGGTPDLAGKIAGASGSPQERQLMELIQAAGGNPQQAMDMLTTSRQLSLKPPGSVNQVVPDMKWYQALIRPFRTIDMMGVGVLAEKDAQEVVRLVGQKAATPEGLAELKKIAEFDPNVRRAMMVYQSAQGAAGNSQREGAQ